MTKQSDLFEPRKKPRGKKAWVRSGKKVRPDRAALKVMAEARKKGVYA